MQGSNKSLCHIKLCTLLHQSHATSADGNPTHASPIYLRPMRHREVVVLVGTQFNDIHRTGCVHGYAVSILNVFAKHHCAFADVHPSILMMSNNFKYIRLYTNIF